MSNRLIIMGINCFELFEYVRPILICPEFEEEKTG